MREVNACRDPDLFWALKGGGGGSFGVVTRLTLATHDLPSTFGLASLTVRADTDAAFSRLAERIVGFYAEALFGPVWGEQIAFTPENALELSRWCSRASTQEEAAATWQPFLDWVAADPRASPRRRADRARGRRRQPLRSGDAQAGARPRPRRRPAGRAGGQRLLGLEPGRGRAGAARLPLRLGPGGAARARAARRARRRARRRVAALAGDAPPQQGPRRRPASGDRRRPRHRDEPGRPRRLRARDQRRRGRPAWPGLPGHEPDVAAARRDRAAVGRAMDALVQVGAAGAYVAESDFFAADWQGAFWGPHYPRLLAIKDRYDPDGLFIVHHGVGSERWSPDGFTRL